ncbi:tannase/feruloyl esterase family alpha/beta hydrolase [Sphingomonas sp. MAH-20]|uniref:Tannase/feruloyl esterase family alpha/beta hydrolase n=1 Tax=Sphingomonas horti TaxID=2682842 RepID=A0A6I4IYM7_9SPHN|nr:tannase/feruloyl esterase family alpha/beta hydrolase [Sphingomonas horti]
MDHSEGGSSLIAPRLALDFYRRAGASGDFYRLFMVPGMSHCQGGTGPVDFGQSAAAPAATADADHDIREALEHWVEQHVAPVRLLASKPGSNVVAELRPEQAGH